jgi:hypothetical protein
VWLDVPYTDKDTAKRAGARWDREARRWYDPHPPSTGLARWAALTEIPDLLPGEDRGFGAGLFVDLVPASCWFTNVRTCVSSQDWERLRRMITRRAGQRCELCGRGEDRAVRRWLEAHERWAYHDDASVQALRRLLCVCSDCHRATHYGLAEISGHADQALAQLRAVTAMTAAAAEHHIDEAFHLWHQRSQRVWRLDPRMLTSAGITIAPPPEPATRARIAETNTRTHREA